MDLHSLKQLLLHEKNFLLRPGSFVSLTAFAGETSELPFGNQINSVKQINLMCDPLNNSNVSLYGRQYMRFFSSLDDSFH